MARALPQGFRRKKNGSIEYRFMIGEERFSVSGSTVKECREKERKKRDTVAAGQYIRNEKITVAEYFEEWERGRAGTVKEASLRVERRGIMPALNGALESHPFLNLRIKKRPLFFQHKSANSELHFHQNELNGL